MMDWEKRTSLVVGDDGIEKLNNASVIIFGVGGVGGFAAEAIARAGVKMMDWEKRTSLVVGDDGIEKLNNASVIIFGVGGVGGFAAEAIARAGVGNITIVDFDDVDITNINRQIIALHSTVGKMKVDVFKERIKDINPNVNITAIAEKYTPENGEELLSGKYDYAIDAIDMITSKIHLIETCTKKGIKIISSMGMGNKLDPTKIELTDIYKTNKHKQTDNSSSFYSWKDESRCI